jgi:site-specific DNA recombinase
MGLFIAFSAEDSVLVATEHLAKRLDIGVKSILAAYHSAEKSEVITRHMNRAAETGHWQAKPPYGYKLVPCDSPELPQEFRCCGRHKKLCPTPEGEIVTEVFRRMDAGQSGREIRDWLRKKLRRKVEYGWIRKRLDNPAYTGAVLYGKEHKGKYVVRGVGEDVIRTENAHPALVDKDTYIRVQKRLRRPGPKSRQKALPFDGVVWCGCGKKARRTGGKATKNGGLYNYYICPERHKGRGCDVPLSRVSAKDVEKALTEAFNRDFGDSHKELSEQLGIGKAFASLILPEFEHMVLGSADLRKRLQAEIANLTRKQDSVYEDKLERRVPAGVASRKLAEIEEKLAEARADLESLKKPPMDAQVLIDWL